MRPSETCTKQPNGATRFVRFNVGLEIAVSLRINDVDYALRDEATVAELVGSSAGDIVKGLISLGGAAMATATLPATASVIATRLVFVVLSVIFSKGVNLIDERNGYSQEMTTAVEEFFQ
jgi:hypothetical protein